MSNSETAAPAHQMAHGTAALSATAALIAAAASQQEVCLRPSAPTPNTVELISTLGTPPPPEAARPGPGPHRLGFRV